MQELRFVLIIVGGLAIAALLFHGLWTSKKEGKSKFGDKPLGKLNAESDDVLANEPAIAPEYDYEIIRKESKERKEPEFAAKSFEDPLDPLIAGYDEQKDNPFAQQAGTASEPEDADDLPHVSAVQPDDEPEALELKADAPAASFKPEEEPAEAMTLVPEARIQPGQKPAAKVTEEAPAAEEQAQNELEVIVLNVHCSGKEPFVGTKLFDSMQQNGLLYGEMDIFHRHADLSGTGKVLFSVANMMQPGTLAHHDPAEFTTKGISFFMTLPCYGDPDQNFKLMLKTAQQIADDMGGNVLDDARNLMTPDRLAKYRKQIQEFKARNA